MANFSYQSCLLVVLIVLGTIFDATASAGPSQQINRRLLLVTAQQQSAAARQLRGARSVYTNSGIILASSQETAAIIAQAAAGGAAVTAVVSAGTIGNELSRKTGKRSTKATEFNTFSIAAKPEPQPGQLRRP